MKAREKGMELIYVYDKVDVGPTGSVTGAHVTIYGGTLHPQKVVGWMTFAFDKAMPVDQAANELAKACEK